MAEKRSPEDPAQAQRFVDAAKLVEADESGKVFQRAMKKIVPAAKKRKKPK